MSAGELEAKAWRSGSVRLGDLRRFERRQRKRDDRQPVLLAFLVRDRALDETDETISEPGRRHAVAAENAGGSRADDRKQVSAMMVIALVKQLSVSVGRPRVTFPTTGHVIKA